MVVGESRRLKVGLDLDDTLSDYTRSLIQYAMIFRNIHVDYKKIKDEEFHQHFGLTRANFTGLLADFAGTKWYEEIPLISGAYQALEEISKFADLNILTSRHRNNTQVTLNWKNVKLRGINIGSINFCHNPFSAVSPTDSSRKSDIAQRLGLDFMVEDSQKYANEIASQGVKVLLLRRPWNESYVPIEGVSKVDGWSDVVRRLKKAHEKVQ